MGLDVGYAAIKTVVFRKGFGQSPTFKCQGIRFPDGLEREETNHEFSVFIRRFLSRHGLLQCPTVASISGECVLSRVLTFPFSNTKMIAKAVPFELERLIPLSLEDVVIDHVLLSSTPQHTQVLAVAVPKEKLDQKIDLLSRIGVNVRAIEVHGLALCNAFRWVHSGPIAQGVLLLDVGHATTSCCFVGPEGVWGIRTILFGVKDLPGCREEEAKNSRNMKEGGSERMSSAGDALSQVQQKTECSAWDALRQTLLITMHAFEHQTKVKIGQTYVFGGGAALERVLADLKTQLEVGSIQVCPGPVGTSGRIISPVFLPALGLSVKYAFRTPPSGVNFVRNRLPTAKQRQEGVQAWGRVAIGAGLVAVLGLTDFGVMHYLKESRYEELKRHLRSQFQEVFPHAQLIVNEIQQTQTAMVQDQRLLAFFRGDQISILNMLAELSQTLSQEEGTEVHEVIIDGVTIKLRATTRSFEAVERIKKAFSRVRWIQDVQVTESRAGDGSQRVNFNCTATVKAV